MRSVLLYIDGITISNPLYLLNVVLSIKGFYFYAVYYEVTEKCGFVPKVAMINVYLVHKVAMKSVYLLEKVAMKNVVFLLFSFFFVPLHFEKIK